jgi:8-oxo-dGTP diphosphatase
MTNIFELTKIRLIDDKYDGVTIDSSTIPLDISIFENSLKLLIDNIKSKKLLWINIDIKYSYLIPILTKYDFIFHHCNDSDITMLKRLIPNSIIPTAINHTLGVGAVVIQNNKILVIKDKIWQRFKLPGGYIDSKENISQALKREVFEETGIDIELSSIVSLGYFYPSQFDKSNLYIVCSANALSNTINIVDSDEIIDAKWMDIDEYFDDEDIHQYNKDIVKSAISKNGLKLGDNNYFIKENSINEYFF